MRSKVFQQGFLFCLAGTASIMAQGCSGTVTQETVGSVGGEDGSGGSGGLGGDEPRITQGACNATPSVAPGRWRRLTALQYSNTVRDLLGQTPDTKGFVADTRTGPFSTNALLPPMEGDIGLYDTLAQTVAAKAVANLNTLVACDTKAVGEDKCATQFIDSFGARAYRRPLQAAEKASFEAVYKEGKQDNFATGIQLVVEAMLSSPSFLYLVESGLPADNGLRKLTGYEIASRLSYVFTGSMPDGELFGEAAKGTFNTADGIRKYAAKLLATDKFIDVAGQFHVELLGVDAVTSSAVSKPAKFSNFDAPMRAAMLQEPRKFVQFVMTKGDGSVEQLLSGGFVFPAGPLASVYGANARPDSDGRAAITDGTRKGLLTLAGVQAVHPKGASPNQAVNRGRFIRENLLCEVVPPPSVEVKFTGKTGGTAQERLREHQDNATCRGCHQLMDSIGFGFERYDAMGAYRTKDDEGHDIDSSGKIFGLAEDGNFNNAGEMAETLARSPEVRACLSTQWLRFALGRDPSEEDACSMQQITDAFSQEKGDIKSALLSLVTSDAFRFNRGQ